MEQWTKDRLLKELKDGQLRESETIEFKEQWTQNSGKSISAIGNGEKRGWLIIGANDDGHLLDKDSQWAKKQQHVKNVFRRGLFPYPPSLPYRCGIRRSGYFQKFGKSHFKKLIF